MTVKHELELRGIARSAVEVAKLINQGGRHPGSFQNTVQNELPRGGPDTELQSIQLQLEGVAVAVESYLSRRTG